MKIDIEQLLESATQLDTPDLERLLSQINLLLAQRKAPTQFQQETRLLQKINQPLPVDIQQRYDELRTKLLHKTIAPDEYQELLNLIDEVELAGANRLEALLDLAQLRHLSLGEVMEQLGIRPPPPVPFSYIEELEDALDAAEAELELAKGEDTTVTLTEAESKEWLDEDIEQQMLAEQERWFAQPEAQRAAYRGQYIAIRHGEVIDQDVDQRVLVRRVRVQYGNAPIPILSGDEDRTPEYVIHRFKLMP